MSANLAALTKANAARWAAMKADSARNADFVRVAAKLITYKPVFQRIEARTGVPWWVVAVIFQRESGGHFDAYLGNGQPLGSITTEIPRGRGPFRSWEAGCYDALIDCPPYASAWKDWMIGGTMTLLEQYNGLGYAGKLLPSPYIWSGTNQYQRGKYVRDGVFDPNVVDHQLGCAAIIAAMRAKDSSIKFAGESSPIGPVIIGGGAIATATAAAAGIPMWAIVAGLVTIAAVIGLIIWWRRRS